MARAWLAEHVIPHDRQGDVNVERLALAVHGHKERCMAQGKARSGHTMVLIAQDQGNLLRVVDGIIGYAVIRDFQRSDPVAARLKLLQSRLGPVDGAPRHAAVLLPPHLADGGMGRSGRDAGQQHFLRVQGVREPKDRPNVHRVGNALADDDQIQLRPRRQGPQEPLQGVPAAASSFARRRATPAMAAS